MLKSVFSNLKVFTLLFLLLLFFFAWGSFTSYQINYSYNYLLSSTFNISNQLIPPISLLIINLFNKVNSLADILSFSKSFLLYGQLFNVVLFFYLFDRKNKFPKATLFYLLSPIFFYNLSILDFKQVFFQTIALIYVYINYQLPKFKFKNIFLLYLFLNGMLYDYAMAGVVLLDLFFDDKTKDTIIRIAIALCTVLLFRKIDAISVDGIKALSLFYYPQDVLNIGSHFKNFLFSHYDFLTGQSGFGLNVIEYDFEIKDVLVKTIILACILGTIFKFYLKKSINVLIFIFLLFLFSYSSVGSNVATLFFGGYINTITYRADFTFVILLAIVIFLARSSANFPKISNILMGVAIFSWLSVQGNIKNPAYNITRVNAPVFWGIQNNTDTGLSFQLPYIYQYPNKFRLLKPKEQVFANGLNRIDFNFLENTLPSEDKMKLNNLLGVKIYQENNRYLQSQKLLADLYLKGVVTQDQFVTIGNDLNNNLKNKAHEAFYPLTYDLSKDTKNYNLAKSLYALMLFDFADDKDSGKIKEIENDFGNIYKTQ